MENNYPQETSTGDILRDAFSYWSRTLLYQVLFTLIYMSILFLVTYYFSSKYGILEQYELAAKKIGKGLGAYMKEITRISSSPEYQKLTWATILTMVFLYPLNLGLMKIFRKTDLNEKIKFEDLFAGYVGSNFFIYASYFLFWMMIYSYTAPTFFLAVIWVLVTLFAAPLMFFMDKRIFEIFKLNMMALKRFPLQIIACVFIAFFVKYGGIITIFGALFTYPFWNAVIYSLYKHIFVEKG